MTAPRIRDKEREAAQGKAWRLANPERYKARYARYNREYRETHRQSDIDRQRKHRYGLTREAYEALLAAQGGVCAVCSRTERLVVDHSHETGQVRAIICNHCNVSIGMAGDSPVTLRALASYLESSV